MNANNVLTLVAMAALGFVAYKAFKTQPPRARTYAEGDTSQIANSASPGDAAWGWSYFSDGVSIGPDGSYYKGSNKVWSPQ